MGQNDDPLPSGNAGGTGSVFDGKDARMKKKLVVTVGNEMMGDDAAGPLLARMIKHSPLTDWELLDGGNVPENYIFKIREMEPERVVIVDAADMDLQTGEIRLIDKDGIGNVFIMTTHSLPLTYLMEAIQEFVSRVELIGIQPEVVAFGYPLSPKVKQAVEGVYAWLEQGGEEVAATRANLRAIKYVDSGQDGGADEIDCSARDQIWSSQRSP
jgi:hydrogenase 3 maturation protease